MVTREDIDFRQRAQLSAMDTLRLLIRMTPTCYEPHAALALEIAKFIPHVKLVQVMTISNLDQVHLQPIREVLNDRATKRTVRRLPERAAGET